MPGRASKSVVSVTDDAVSKLKKPLSAEFRVDGFEEVTFVCGQTLERFWQQGPLVNKMADFLVYTPTRKQVETQCDRCPRRHQPLNLACSRTKGTPTKYVVENVLYGPTRRFGFEVLDTMTEPGSKIAKVRACLWEIRV